MFPWVYGFTWDAGNIIFLGLFFGVVGVIAATFTAAVWRSGRDLKSRRVETIRWHTEFEDLPSRSRRCRHELTGDVTSRECPNAFDCRECAAHAGFLKRTPAPECAASSPVYGLAVHSDRFYHRGHTWVRPDGNGMLTVGIDDFAKRLLGTPDGVNLPSPGSTLTVNGTGWTMRKKGTEVRMLSPVEGVVVATGGPEQGWYLRVAPDGQPNLKHLLRPDEVKPWLTRELERLELACSAEGAGLSLADGGELTDDLTAAYPEADWDSVLGEVFLNA
jgi:hypothetical protein